LCEDGVILIRLSNCATPHRSINRHYMLDQALQERAPRISSDFFSMLHLFMAVASHAIYKEQASLHD
jgi:hypothetical protein